ncbi:MAG TPA: hypothetical protein VFH47_06315, partial [Candidatus Thermoplasmatota archaeon]|nr:hypothetical protein [Candidatus Thermoplasmatota archaeon]
LGNVRPDASVELRVHAVGAVVVRIRVPFQGVPFERFDEEVEAIRIGGLPLAEVSRQLLDRVVGELRPAFVEPYDVRVDPERYIVHCITAGADATELVTTRRREMAALITGEPDEVLAPNIVDSALKHTIRYYEHEVIVVGWDHAVIVARPGTYEDALDVMELANLELLELRTYDTYLDRKLDQSFRTLDRLWAPGGVLRSGRKVLREISALRVDFARLTDNLHDTGKFFGEWYLAKLHSHLRDSFHLYEWEKAVDAKMDTLGDMFHLAGEEANHRRATVLEAMIVLLFILDLYILVFGLH